MPQLTDEQQALVNATAIATVDRLILKAQDPDVAERVMDTWSGQVQKVVGKAVLRFLWVVFFACLGVAGVKLGLFDKLFR